MAEREAGSLARRHLRAGWWSLLAFLSLGVLLEMLHGFKAPWYLSVSNGSRRLLLTLAHAHGTLLGLAQIGFAFMVSHFEGWDPRNRRLAGNCLLGAGVLIPGGFFLGGLNIYAGDPGLGVVLVPAGALLLFAGCYLAARAAMEQPASSPPAAGRGRIS